MSTIPDYNSNAAGFVGWLDGQAIDALPGHKNPKLAELLALLDGKITISADKPTPLTREQLEKLLAAYLTDPAMVKGGWVMGQFLVGQDAAIVAIKGMIERGEKQEPKITSWTVSEFMLSSLSALTMDRIDDDIISTFTGVMTFQDRQRKALGDELKDMTAELKIYGVIQSQINVKLSSGNSQYFNTGLDLMDYKLYGYESEEKFRAGPEFKLLSNINSDAVNAAKQALAKAEAQLQERRVSLSLDSSLTPEQVKSALSQLEADVGKQKANVEQVEQYVSAKTFLESSKKQSGAMSHVEDEYAYNKDNNKLGNFSTSVSDRARPLNDQVSEKTTRLNDVSSRYNAAIEALNRFIQKYDSIMRDIIGAI